MTATGAVVLVAHGSRDPRAAATTRALVRAVAAARPGLDVRAAYLDHTRPRPAEVLAALDRAGHPDATVVPLLLTAAYHNRVDLPAVLAEARADGLRLPVRVTEVLGPIGGVVPAPLLAGLRRRLLEALGMRQVRRLRAGVPSGLSVDVGEAHVHTQPDGAVRSAPAKSGDYAPLRCAPFPDKAPGPGVDGVVLAAAGTGDATARATVEESALALGQMLGVPCRVGYASAAPPLPGEAVAELRAAGARRVAVATYFLATGLLYQIAVDSALAAGATAVAAPLGDARELAHLVLARMDTGRVGRRGATDDGSTRKHHSKTPRDPGRRAGLLEDVDLRMSAHGA